MNIIHVSILIVLIFFKPAFTQAASFIDVSLENTFNDAIQYLQKSNIAEGYPDGSFKPDNFIGRAEFTKIAVKAYGYNDLEFLFCDPLRGLSTEREIQRIPQDSIHISWAAPYICIAMEKRMLDGYPDGTFRPNNEIDFAEAAKILAKSFLATPGHIPSVLPDDKWFVSYVKDMAKANAIPISIRRIDQKITRGEMAEMIYRLKEGIKDKASTSYDELVDTNDVSINDFELPTGWLYRSIPGTPFELPLPLNAEIVTSKDGTIDIYPLSAQDRSKNSIYSFYLSLQVCDPGAWCNDKGPEKSVFPSPRTLKSEDNLIVNFYKPWDFSFNLYLFGIRSEGVYYAAQLHMIIDGQPLPDGPQYRSVKHESKAETAASLMRYIRLSSK